MRAGRDVGWRGPSVPPGGTLSHLSFKEAPLGSVPGSTISSPLKIQKQ